ncbi:hypothetical protein CI109_107201 [Kwoniella shandongensis]|uniref:Uncharacterized protein n=1 Tax=Kwoniella shandongensis TaxID=1734106 RepID=A0A5M6C2C7_9TREE|nr:uncharacterized protein CI109_002484 [Kwoniella shandongensis]KAA5529143.1 hypothetical protein CI109_002484 [Kwoniella shandongensis]
MKVSSFAYTLAKQTSRARVRNLHTSTKMLDDQSARLRELYAKFQDPTSHYHIPPGTNGPEHEEDHSTSRPPITLTTQAQAQAQAGSAIQLQSRETPDDRPWLNEGSGKKELALRYFREQGYDTAGVLTWPVAWGNCDTFQHVNNVNYLQWFESARIRYFESWGTLLPEGTIQRIMAGKGTGVIIKDVSIKYKAPVTYPDTMMICSQLHGVNADRASFGLKHIAWSLKDERVVALCDSTIVMYDYDNVKKGVMSDEFRKALETVEASYEKGGSA